MGATWSEPEKKYVCYIPGASLFGCLGDRYYGKTRYGAAPRRACGTSELCTMFASEWNIDAQALATDGQYWRSVYGGSRLVLGGLRCEPSLWVVFRLLAATCSDGTWTLQHLGLDGTVLKLEQPFDDFAGLRACNGRAVAIASNNRCGAGLLELDLRPNTPAWIHTPAVPLPLPELPGG